MGAESDGWSEDGLPPTVEVEMGRYSSTPYEELEGVLAIYVIGEMWRTNHIFCVYAMQLKI